MNGRLLVVVLVAAVLCAAAGATSRPDWLDQSESRVLAAYFPGAHVTLVSVHSSARTIRVVFEFRDVVACWRCLRPVATAPEGRFVRVTFARTTHRLSGAMKLCDVRGVSEPIQQCLAD